MQGQDKAATVTPEEIRAFMHGLAATINQLEKIAALDVPSVEFMGCLRANAGALSGALLPILTDYLEFEAPGNRGQAKSV